MKNIQELELKKGSSEEILPGFEMDFPYIATQAELDKFPESKVPWHWHGPLELFYMESGCLEYTTPNGKWVFPAGSGGLVNSNVLHTTSALRSEDKTVQFLHLFDWSLISGEYGSRMERKYVRPIIDGSEIEIIPFYPDDQAQREILQKIRQTFDLSDREWGYEFQIREALTRIWMSIFESARHMTERNKNGRSGNEQMKQMMIYIHEHYQHRIRVEEMAEAAHINKRGCFRLFQENLHMTPVEYIQSYRLQTACQMLAKGKKSITEIASQCGLGSSSYFGKVFREKFGCTPLEYRNSWHNYDI